MNLYTQDGVNVAAGDSFSAYAGNVCRDSWSNSPFVRVHDLSSGYFRGVRSFSFHGLPEGCTMDMTSDGNGTKVVLNAMAGNFEDAGCDLLAMSAMDLVRNGGRALVFNNVLDTANLGEDESEVNMAHRRLMDGLASAATVAEIVLFRGETAELGVCIGSENPTARVKFNWSGSCLGVYHPNLMITGKDLQPGQAIIALKENGFRANGISSVRKALVMRYGQEWWECREAKEHIIEAATPSVLYERFLTRMNGWHSPNQSPEPLIKMEAIIHLTGGGFEGKLGHDLLFPRGLSADLDNLWDPPKIMGLCSIWRGMSDQECYSTWNGGQGALIVLNEADASNFIKEAGWLDLRAKICGQITREDTPRIRIRSQFTPGREVIFRAA